MTIQTLITAPLNMAVVRDQIGAILLAESAAQQALAEAAAKDPAPWNYRVYIEAANPWDSWTHADDQHVIDTSPVVNVSFGSSTFDQSKSSVVSKIAATPTFNVDCYVYAVASQNGDGTHTPGDQAAGIAALNFAGLIFNILMAGTYTYLGMQGLITKRFPSAFQLFQPDPAARHVDNVVAVHIGLDVDLYEFSPQVQGAPLQYLSLQVTRASDGQLIAQSDTSFPISGSTLLSTAGLYGSGGTLAGATLILTIGGVGPTTLTMPAAGSAYANTAALLAGINTQWPGIASQGTNGGLLLTTSGPLILGAGTANHLLGLST